MRNAFFENYIKLTNLFDGAYIGMVSIQEVRGFAKKAHINLSDFCDANDLGTAGTWTEAVEEYSRQIKNGER